MGEIIDLHPEDDWRVWVTTVQSYMHFPDDGRARERFIYGTFAHLCRTDLEFRAELRPDLAEEFLRLRNVLPDIHELKAEINLNRVRGRNGKNAGIHYGEIAGEILLLAMNAEAHGRKVSKKLAFEILHGVAAKKLVGAASRNLEDIWKRFSPVAHFWAAHIARRSSVMEFASRDAYLVFLATAEHIRVFGENHKKESSKPLLDAATTFKLPDWVWKGRKIPPFRVEMEEAVGKMLR